MKKADANAHVPLEVTATCPSVREGVPIAMGRVA